LLKFAIFLQKYIKKILWGQRLSLNLHTINGKL
jgi:hypothetical protein